MSNKFKELMYEDDQKLNINGWLYVNRKCIDLLWLLCSSWSIGEAVEPTTNALVVVLVATVPGNL